MKIRIITSLILILLLMPILVSCAGITSHSSDTEGAVPQTTAPITETVPIPEDETVYRHTGNPDYPIMAKAYLKALPDRDYNGATFFISSPSTGLYDPSEIHYISETIEERNSLVEEKYNINIEVAKTDAATMYEEASKAYLAGMYYTNLMCIPFAEVGNFDIGGLLTNLRSLPLLDLSMPYFNQSSVKALSVGYRTLGVAGEASPVTDLPCVIYNKDIADSIGLSDMYETALDGELTWDVFLSYMTRCGTTDSYTSAVLKGDDTYDYIFKSLGENFLRSSALSIPSAGVVRYSMDWAATYARAMLDSGSALGITKDNAITAFNEGKALFTVGRIGDLDLYRNSNIQIGILPMPKRNADSPYRSAVSGNGLVMTVPNGTTNSEMASLVLSALNAASYGYISETVVDYLHATALPDNRSADILDVIVRSAVYDLSTALEVTSPSVLALKENIRSIIEAGDFSSYDAIISAVDLDMAQRFPLKY